MRAPIAALLLLASCAAQQQRSLLQELNEAVDAYNEAYRWRNYERAAAFLPNDLRSAFLATYEDDDNSVHVEAYEVTKVDLKGDREAVVTVRMRFMALPSVTVEKRVLTQYWHKIESAWILEREENSIRELDTGAEPKNPEAKGSGPANPVEGDTRVRVTGPGGKELRTDEGMEEEPQE